MKHITATAPTRIDLAGGTLDIWPLNLFFDNPVTINMAINIEVSAKISSRDDGKVILVSEDRKRRIEFDGMANIHHRHPLGLLSRLLEYFIPENDGVEIVTHSSAPAGAGLAGSSALNIALCGALARFSERKLSGDQIIAIAKDVEAALLGVPTGLQDYGAAMYGSVNAFSFPPGGMNRASLARSAPELEKIVTLFYSGQSRNSGINNWEMFKRVIDKDKKTIKLFAVIADCAREAASALETGDYGGFAKAVGAEWKARKSLFPAISTDDIDSAIAAGKKAGATAARICGAGGGGCFFMIAEPDRHEAVSIAAESAGARRLRYNISPNGLKIIGNKTSRKKKDK